MNKREFTEIIESFAPLSLQEEWDNSGWQISCREEGLERVLVALEISDEVIDEAIEEGADVILTHHPLFFASLKSIAADTVVGRHAIRLIKAGVSVYSSHTPFDICRGGNNDYFGSLMGISEIETLGAAAESMEAELGQPSEFTAPTEAQKYCRCGNFKQPMSIEAVAELAAKKLQINRGLFHYAGAESMQVERVCWCTGAGAGFTEEVKKSGACDLYITGDLKYHEARHACDIGLAVLDVGHYATEKIFAHAIEASMIAAMEKRGVAVCEVCAAEEAASRKKDLKADKDAVLDKASKLCIIKSRAELNPFSVV